MSTAANNRQATTDTRERILRAALDLAADTGLRKLSMDEIAGRAKVARATLYLHFPGRDALVDALVSAELSRFFAELRGCAERHDNPDRRFVATFAFAFRWLRDHSVLKTVLRVNSQIIMPYVLGDAPAIDLGRSVATEILTGMAFTGEISREEFAEHITREFHSLILAPSKIFELNTEAAVENYARRFLLPLLR